MSGHRKKYRKSRRADSQTREVHSSTKKTKSTRNLSRREARRSMQQNFLRDGNIARKIVREAEVGPEDTVLELGAGGGKLTRPLSRSAGRVLAVEYDPRWAARLEKDFARWRNVEVERGDALRVALPDGPFKVVANVPFYITTEILQMLLDDPASSPETAHLLVQKEVAEKHARETPTTLKTLRWSPWHELSASMSVPASAFHPRPNVSGRLLIARKRRRPLIPESRRDEFREFTRLAFTGRGQSVGRRLRAFFTRTQTFRLARDIGFALSAEPSSLTVAQWSKLFQFKVENDARRRLSAKNGGTSSRRGRRG